MPRLVAEVTERPRGSRCGEGLAARQGLTVAAAERAARDLGVLAHPIRLRILEMLARRGGEVCVCDLEGALPVKQPTVSHHLRLLREAGLVDIVRRGVWAYYFVKTDALGALRGRIGQALRGLG